MKDSLVLNMDDVEVKRRIMQKLGALTGLWEFWLRPRKKTRTLDQNAYYHVAVVKPFQEWLIEQWGESITHEQAHEILKDQILGTDERIIAGVPVSKPATTTTLDTIEFSEYIEDCARWLAEFAGVVVIPSELFYEMKG